MMDNFLADLNRVKLMFIQAQLSTIIAPTAFMNIGGRVAQSTFRELSVDASHNGL